MRIHGETLIWETYRDEVKEGMSDLTAVNSTEKYLGGRESRRKLRKAASNTEI